MTKVSTTKTNSSLIKNYYQLTKPGIIYGNALTAAAGFLLASKGQINFWLFLTTLIGISLVIASACVFNNFIDRDIDLLMTRTKSRALAARTIRVQSALVFAFVLGLIGFYSLWRYTNLLTVAFGIIAIFTYVVLYGFVKRFSTTGTLVGSIPGALPIVAGYTAVTNNFDLGAFVLFLILVVWQMPHFYAIAIYRADEYKKAKIPVLPLVSGVAITKKIILLYVIAFILAITSLTLIGLTGYAYLAVMLFLSIVWLWFGIRGFSTNNDKRWARQFFLLSLVVLLIFSLMISVNSVLP